MMLVEKSEIRKVYEIFKEQKQGIMIFLQDAVYYRCKNRKNEWFAAKNNTGNVQFNTMKKIILLTTLCLSMATGTAFAQQYGGGSGTASDPFLISSNAHMEELARMVNGGATTYEGYHFKLTTDLTGITTIIGNSTRVFSGIFDGTGHTIELNINTTRDYAGVFGYLFGAMIKNTKVRGMIVAYSSSFHYAGGICGSAENSTISNCYNMGNISDAAYAGGICGSGGTIINCYNTGKISSRSSSSYAGGICGSDGIISNCYNMGDISSSSSSSSNSSYAGGICGGAANNNITVSNCCNTGNISSSYSYAGGICGGAANNNIITISNCYNTGNISASASDSYSYAGGICGSATYSTIINCYNTGKISSRSSSYSSYAGGICGRGNTISNCYNTGDISSSSYSSYSSYYHSYAGGICGYSYSGRPVSNCFAANATITVVGYSIIYTGRIVGNDDSGPVSNCHALTSMKINELERSSMNADSKDGVNSEEADFKNESWLTSVLKWDFGTVWTISGSSEWPVLKEYTENISLEIVPSALDFTAAGETKSVTIISNVSWTADRDAAWITVSPASGSNNGAISITAAANRTTSQRTGTVTISGRGISQTISIMQATDAAFAQNYGGGSGTESDPFLISSRAHIEELATIVNDGTTYAGCHFKLTADLTGITTIIGSTRDFFFSGIFDGDGHTIELNISTTGFYAGVFGHLSGATVKNTKVSGSVSVSSSYSSYAGGICGYANNSTINNCYNAGIISAAISSTASVGGICGYANNKSSIINCYNMGSISAAASASSYSYYYYAGGICGNANDSNSTIINCYNTGSISDSYSRYSYAGGICGSGGTINNCYNTGNISAVPNSSNSSSYAGGICGSDATINNCYNTGNISAVPNSSNSSSYAGGICGSGGIINNCYNTGEITTTSKSTSSYAGGICGSDGIINNCYNTGNISTTTTSSSNPSYAGGICGGGGIINNCYNTGNISASSYSYSSAGGICGGSGTISNCYNRGNISATTTTSSYNYYSSAGGICGNGGTISNCFAANATITTTSSNSPVGRIDGSGSGRILNCYALITMKLNNSEKRSKDANSKDGADSEEADFKNESWLIPVLKWDFETIWTISGSSGWPVLKEQTGDILLEITPSTLDFTVAGETKPVTITSNVRWAVDRDAEWITVDLVSGSNNGAINVTTAENTTTSQRTGIVTVVGGGITKTVNITQAAYVPPANTLTVSTSTLDFTASGETKPVTVTSNVSWTTEKDAEWITIFPASGNNNGVISITAAANTTTIRRTGNVTVVGGGIEQTVSITQATDVPQTNTLTVSPATLDFTASGETQSVTITSNVSWIAGRDADAEWITVSPAMGSNNGVISITAAANTTTSQRTGTVTVSGGGIDQIISITQATDVPQTNTLTVSPETLDFTASGETKSVTITSNVSWIAGKYAGAEWITVSPAMGSNNGAINVTAAANMTTSQRTGTVIVSGGGIDQIISITQAADIPPTLIVSTSTLDFTASGETKSVTVTSNVSWTIDKDAEWITVTPPSGSNDGTISVTAAANTTTSQRTGTVTVSGGGIDQIINITQATDIPPILTVSPATLDFIASGEIKPVAITSNVSWTADKDVEWITVSPASGSNDGTISVTAATNTTTSQRTGFVAVTGGGIMRVITVTQAADGTTSILTVSATDVEIATEGGSQDITIQSNTSWTAVRSDAWASISPASGTNDGTVSITAAANSTENTRTAIVIIAGGGLTRTVTVTQKSDRVGNAAVGVTDVRYFNNRLYVNTPVAERIAIYSLNGMMMYQSQKQPGIATFDLRSLPRGVMIVRGDSGWVKKEIKQ